jgi:hypothetical protein
MEKKQAKVEEKQAKAKTKTQKKSKGKVKLEEGKAPEPTRAQDTDSEVQRDAKLSRSEHLESPAAPASGTSATRVAQTCIMAPLSRADGVRIISDMDDTVKHSDILGGAREVFR